MATPLRWLYGDVVPVVVPFGSTQVLTVGDLVAIDTNGLLYRAEDEVWDTSEAVTRDNFVSKFVGVVGQSKRTGDALPYGNSTAVARVDTTGFFEADLDTATTLKVGDWVGPNKASGNALVSQVVKKVTVGNQAVGEVVEAGTSLTRVKFKALSRKIAASMTNALESGV